MAERNKAFPEYIRKAFDAFRPPERLTVSEWADKYRILSEKDSAAPGLWRTDRTPYLKEPMDAFNDRAVKDITFVAGTQLGKTVMEQNMIGFAIARMRWRGKNLVLSLVLATLMVPFETIAVPLVFWVAKLPSMQWVVDGFLIKQGMLNTYQVQILPFIANALAIFLFAQHFGDIPREIDEAARVDGASWWTIYRRIVVPLSGPTFATVAIITMLPAWNSYLWPLMVVQEESMRPVSVGMQYFFQLNPVWGQIMAYCTLITLPVLIIFVVFQRSFVQSLAGTAVKG